LLNNQRKSWVEKNTGEGVKIGGGSSPKYIGVVGHDVSMRTKAGKMPIYELACCRTHGNHIFWSYLWTIKPVSLCACQ